MRVSRGKLILMAVMVAAPIEIGFAHGTGSMSGGASDSMSGMQSRTPEDAARSAYNSGVRSIKKAQGYDADAAKATNPEKAAKAHEKAQQNYSKALEHYSMAIQLKPNMAETYEYRGVLFAKMGRRADAEKDLVTLKKLNPKLAAELQEFLKTGKEEDEYGATSPKKKS